jgi:hypothetical protein
MTLLLEGPPPFAVNASIHTSYSVFGSSPFIVTPSIEAFTVTIFLITLESAIFFLWFTWYPFSTPLACRRCNGCQVTIMECAVVAFAVSPSGDRLGTRMEILRSHKKYCNLQCIHFKIIANISVNKDRGAIDGCKENT